MSYRPFISVVIPTFNRARQVQAALKSVLAQTYPEFEAIVVDDGSTDGTGEALQQLISPQGGNGKQIRYFFQPNQGQSAARNKGIDEARGEWIAFLDSDDVWLPEKLEWQVRAIEQFQEQMLRLYNGRKAGRQPRDGHDSFPRERKTLRRNAGNDAEAVGSLVKSRDPFWVSTLLVRTDAG